MTCNVMRSVRDKSICLKKFYRTDRHPFNGREKQGEAGESAFLSHTRVTEEPLDDLTNQCIWEGRLRCVLCNEIVLVAATAHPNACDSSLPN